MNYKNRLKARTPEFAKIMKRDFSFSDEGILRSLTRVNQVLKNFSEETEAGKAFEIADTARSKSDFSADAGAGVNDSANVTTIDITDITLISTYKSLIPALALDKGLKTPAELVEYTTLVATNSAGKAVAGSTVVNPFAPISPELDFSISGTEVSQAAATTQSFNFPIAKKRVIISNQAGTLIGQDLAGDGKIYWSGSAIADAIEVTVLNYDTGEITFASDPSAKQLTITVQADSTSDKTGDTILKLRRKPVKVEIEAESNNLIFEDNIQDLARMNKMVLGANFGKMALKMVLNALVYTLNSKLVKVVYDQAINALVTPTPEVFDLSTYTHTSFADTKDDLLLGFILRLSQGLQDKSNFEPTYLLVGSAGATILKNDTKAFVQDPAATKVIDGYIGTFAGIPVYRSQFVSLRETADSTGGNYYAHIVAGHRAPDGTVASAMYAEYLSIYSSSKGINWNNPQQYTQLLFNQSQSKAIVDNLITFGKIKYNR